MPALIERYDAFVVDLDGVVWRGKQILPGAKEGLDAIRKAKKRILFLTNNASYSPGDVVARLTNAGIWANDSEVLGSADVAVGWMVSEGFHGKRAMVLGPQNLKASLGGVLEVVDRDRSDVDLVVVARDLDFDFATLDRSALAVRNGAKLVALNRDLTMPLEDRLSPGTGAVLAAIESASGSIATVLGKPEAPMMEAARSRMNEDRVLLIGDRPESDVAGARRVKWDAALVLSGVTIAGDRIEPAPDYLLAALDDITQEIPPYQGRT